MELDYTRARKRKPKGHGKNTPNFNLPAPEPNMIVPTGLVHEQLNQLGGTSGRAEDENKVQKKQNVSANKNARSVVVAKGNHYRAQ